MSVGPSVGRADGGPRSAARRSERGRRESSDDFGGQRAAAVELTSIGKTGRGCPVVSALMVLPAPGLAPPGPAAGVEGTRGTAC